MMMIMPTIPENVTVQYLSSWDEHFMLLQEYMYYSGQVMGDVQEFWMLTQNPKLNQWLVYNKVEMRKKRNQQDPVWMDRKQRLADLGIYFSNLLPTATPGRPQDHATTNNQSNNKEQEKKRRSKRRSRNVKKNKRDQQWMGWVRNEVEEYVEYIPKMRNYRMKSFVKVPHVWLPVVANTTMCSSPAQQTTQPSCPETRSTANTSASAVSVSSQPQKQEQQQNQDLASRLFALARKTQQLARLVAIAA